MSLSVLPEWKQLLLERKRRDEEERERREREEEERLASMPAWKREIIQRRKAKQDEEREREKEKDEGQHTPDVSAIIEEVVVTEQTDSKPNPGTPNQLSIRQNPFIRSENSWRRDNRQQTNNYTVRGRNVETEKEESRGMEREFWKDRDIRIEGTESQSEDRSTGREQVKKCSTSLFYPVTGLRTIKANNIIIIEKEKNNKERLERRESAREEVHREEKRMRMDLREFLAGGGSVTEIRASEVLIIKPPATDEKVEAEIPEVQERVSSREQLERERVWRKEREIEREQRAQTNRKNEVECGGRVSQLLSKFGELPKPPVRSKSTDCFDQLGKNRARYSTGDLHVQEDEDTRPTFRGVPKRSFSFSDRAVCHQENGAYEEELEFRVVERTYSDCRVKPSAMVTGIDPSESESRVTRRWGRPRRDDEGVMLEKRQIERNQTVCRETGRGEEGFTVASIKNPEGVAFARRVQIKQERRENGSERENRRAREEKMDEEIQTDKRRDTMEGQKQIGSTMTWNQDGTNVALKQSVNPSNACTDYNTAIDAQCQVTTPSEDDSLQSSAFTAQPGSRSQQTEDLHCRTERVRELNKPFSCGDPDMTSGEMNQHTAHTTLPTSYLKDQNLSKQATDNSHFTSHISHQPGTLSQNKPRTQEEVTIPTTVFYGVEVSAVRKTSLDKTGDGLERRGSWKAGRPLTRVESLRERLRQQEEMQRGRKTDAMDGTEAEGTVKEVTAIQQEATTLQTLRLFDVTQEVTMAKSSPQLPVPVSLSHLQSASTEREVGEITRDECESDLYRRETEPAHHVEECGSRSIWRRQDFDLEEDEIERELLEEEYLPPSLSPSPPLSDSLDEMSRIYNLKAVGSRTAVCISERKGDISTHHRGTHGQYKPIRTAQSPDILPETAKLWNCGTARDVDKTETVESTGAQTVQRQVERLQLKEQEGACRSQNDREQEAKTAEGQKRPDILKETPKSQVQQKSQWSHPKPQQLKSFTVNARNAQATENTSRSPEQGDCPSSSSPSTTPTPPLFSIRSASGGPGKRGTTITITPRRSGAVTPSAGTSTGPSGTPSRAAPQGQTPTTNTGGNREANKKRYPTAEEIEVIGGYQSLERSCLVKSRGEPKAVKVCFDDIQLERVCEYPSEDCMLESLPCTPHSGSEDGRCGGDQEEDEDEENTSRSDMSVNAGRVRFLRVDESCKLNFLSS